MSDEFVEISVQDLSYMLEKLSNPCNSCEDKRCGLIDGNECEEAVKYFNIFYKYKELIDTLGMEKNCKNCKFFEESLINGLGYCKRDKSVSDKLTLSYNYCKGWRLS